MPELNPNPSPAASRAQSSDSAKYLTFLLGAEAYGVNVLKVREIIRMIDITSVPRMPAYVRGVVNLRGKVVPIVDLRLKFGLAKAEVTDQTCIVVVQIQGASGTPTLTGFIVDAVEEVLNIAPADVEPTPDFGFSLSADYLLGMAKVKGRVKALLDIDRVLAAPAMGGMGPGHTHFP